MYQLNSCYAKCDFEGKILEIDDNFEKILGYSSIEIIKKKRIFNFLYYSDLLVFIDFYFSKNKKKSFIFISSNNTKILFDVTICHVNDEITLYLKKTTIIEYNKEKFILNWKFLNLIIRSKFLIGSFLPVLFSIILNKEKINDINYYLVTLIIFSVFLFHISANTFNDYFDWISGRDKKNLDYILFSTGGSRVLDYKIISPKQMLLIAIFSSILTFLIGVYFIYIKGLIILMIGLIAFFCVFFYSAPPLHLAGKYGLGEIIHTFCLGPLVMYLCITILSTEKFKFIDFLISMPFGLLITSCLLINEYPDSKYDKISNKINLAVLFDVKYIKLLYIIITSFSFLIIYYSINFLNISKYFFSVFYVIPYYIIVVKTIYQIEVSRLYVALSCVRSFNFYLYFSILMILSVFIEIIFLYPW